MCINGSVIAEEVIAPYFFKELFARKSNALVSHKVEEQVIFLWRERNRLAVNADFSARDVDLKTFLTDNIHWLFLCGGAF